MGKHSNSAHSTPAIAHSTPAIAHSIPAITLHKYFTPRATPTSSPLEVLTEQQTQEPPLTVITKKRRRDSNDTSKSRASLFNSDSDQTEQRTPLSTKRKRPLPSRRMSCPSVACPKDSGSHSPLHDYVLIGPHGITELPTPERLGIGSRDDYPKAHPDKRRRVQRKSAPPETLRPGRPLAHGRADDPVVSESNSTVDSTTRWPAAASMEESSASPKPLLNKHHASVPHFKTAPLSRRHLLPKPLDADYHSHPSSLIRSMRQIAKTVFGIELLDSFQELAIQSVFNKQDSLIVISTGAGKSLCYQLPPLMPQAENKFVLVISPLIALMEDQVRALGSKNIPAITTSGGKGSGYKILEDIKRCCYRVIYMSPEYLDLNECLIEEIRDKVLLLAIDEVHCISDWGHSFRPAYRKIITIRSKFPNVPTMGLTATATTEVQQDISKSLNLPPVPTTLHLKSSVNRMNIFYRVGRKATDSYKDFAEMFALPPQPATDAALEERRQKPVDNASINPYSSTIIYIATKPESERLCKLLQSHGVSCKPYHAGHSLKIRSETQRDFMEDRIQVICATVAFGMGIDKPDIRRVVHWSLPSSIEAYTQESGRAGRDRQESEAILLWNEQDVLVRQRVMTSGEEYQHKSEKYKRRLSDLFEAHVMSYVRRKECLRLFLLNYFGETVENDSTEKTWSQGICRYEQQGNNRVITCHYCSSCCKSDSTSSSASEPRRTGAEIDLGKETRILLQCIVDCGGQTGATLPCKVACGSLDKDITMKRLDKKTAHGSGKFRALDWWKQFLKVLVEKGLVNEKARSGGGVWGGNYLAVSVSSEGRRFLSSKNGQPLLFNVSDLPQKLVEKLKIEIKPPSGPSTAIPCLQPMSANEYQSKVLSALRQLLFDLRGQEARARSCRPHEVLRIDDIVKIIEIRPSSLSVLLKHVSLPESCSHVFLQHVVNELVKFTSVHGLGTNQTSGVETRYPSRDIQVERVINICEDEEDREVACSTDPTSLLNEDRQRPSFVSIGERGLTRRSPLDSGWLQVQDRKLPNGFTHVSQTVDDEDLWEF